MSANYDEVMISLGLEPSSPTGGRSRSKARKTKSKAQSAGRPPVDRGHGDYRTYIKGCRCPECRDAHRVHMAGRRAAWATDPSAADRAGHGKPSTYKNYNCRCEACSKANTADVNAYRARRRARLAEVQS